MKLPILTSAKPLKGKRVFLRVDWNVPLKGAFAAEDSLKLTRSFATINGLAKRGAVVLVATHLGRPEDHELGLSTANLLQKIVDAGGPAVQFLGEPLDAPDGLKRAQTILKPAKPGTVFLLENVRYYRGEERDDAKLAKAYAALADIFIDDAFASCHRKHASVVGVAKLLPHFAGPTLVQEVAALDRLLAQPKKPYYAFIGGAKLTTKLPVIQALLKSADKVFIGGAMAHAFFAAKKIEIGKSYVEKEGIAVARKMLKDKKIVLPVDAVVAKKVEPGAKATTSNVATLKKTDAIGDIGPQTMRAWAQEIRQAKTIVWNGPLGVADIPAFSHGSMVVCRAMAMRSKGKAYGVAGGGDTLPVVMSSGMDEWFDHVSTGGGAMLEFIVKKGKLPGLVALADK